MAGDNGGVGGTQVVDLGSLISGPVLSVVDADFIAARKFVHYIANFGFDRRDGPAREGGVDDLGSLRMVEFDLDRPGGEPATVRMPVLSLIPLPLLQIKQAHFQFAVKVLQALPDGSGSSGGRLLQDDRECDFASDPSRFRWKAMLARSGPPDETQADVSPHIDSNMKVQLTLHQSDLPEGIIKLLSIMGENVSLTAQPRRPPDRTALLEALS